MPGAQLVGGSSSVRFVVDKDRPIPFIKQQVADALHRHPILTDVAQSSAQFLLTQTRHEAKFPFYPFGMPHPLKKTAAVKRSDFPYPQQTPLFGREELCFNQPRYLLLRLPACTFMIRKQHIFMERITALSARGTLPGNKLRLL